MPEFPPLEMGRHDFLQRRPPEEPFESVQPQRGFVVGDASAGSGKVSEAGRGLHVAFRVAAVACQTVAFGLA